MNPAEIIAKLKPSENPLWIAILTRVGTELISECSHDYNLEAFLEKGEKLRDLLPTEMIEVKKKSSVKIKP